jgi:hypothetical protein
MKRLSVFLIGVTVYGLCLRAADAQTVYHAGPITAATVARGPSCSPACRSTETASSDWVDIPGTKVQMRLDSPSLLIARFTSESSCIATFRDPTGRLNAGWCAIRILVSPAPGAAFVEMTPSTAHFGKFQVHGDSGTSTLERSAGPISPGLVTVKLQYTIPFAEPGSLFSLRGWHLTVEAASE